MFLAGDAAIWSHSDLHPDGWRLAAATDFIINATGDLANTNLSDGGVPETSIRTFENKK